MTLPSSDSEKTIRKFDIAQVSYCLQDRLGLAKLKLQHGDLHGLKLRDNKAGPSDNEKPSDSSSTFSRSRCETPATSPPIQNATYSRELLRSARSKHAVMFDKRVLTATQPMLTGKRTRSDSLSERPAKVQRVSWKSNHRLPQSSPGHQTLPSHRRTRMPFMSEAPIAELSSPAFHNPSDEENDPDLPLHSFQTVSSMAGSSPPRTPQPRHARLPRADHPFDRENGADLLMYLANSPTPARVAAGSHLFPPSTPPSQHIGLPHMTPNMGTPGQPLNFADFVNVTPSPAQPPWPASRTPLFSKEARKKLDFDAMHPPPASPRAGLALSPRVGLALIPASPRAGLALKFQLGGELKR
ncbi:hypothetical protein N7495_008000 [Penicillium taxi]|uniref:uncharacterized protein n=1 Tax=Penicillium taxi TaxID=168475 RepID=UPI00254508D7|nr:uncharacterized protein N7495_008000 [Penicillium taxi]KAJ5887959.1 hypothetical protein N7495_008000 [Penicillium taxi]